MSIPHLAGSRRMLSEKFSDEVVWTLLVKVVNVWTIEGVTCVRTSESVMGTRVTFVYTIVSFGSSMQDLNNKCSLSGLQTLFLLFTEGRWMLLLVILLFGWWVITYYNEKKRDYLVLIWCKFLYVSVNIWFELI